MVPTGYSLGSSLFLRLTAILAKTNNQKNSQHGNENRNTTEDPEPSETAQNKSSSRSFFGSAKNRIRDIESRFDDNFVCRTSFIDVGAGIDKFLFLRL